MIYVYIAIALALTSAGGWLGYTYMDGKVVRAEAATELANETSRLYAKSNKQERAKEVIVTKYVTQLVKVPGEIREIIKEVESANIACIQNTATGMAMLDSSFRVLHDKIAATATAAYAGPKAADGTAPPPTGVTPEEVLTGVADNYAICAENALKLVNLQAYVQSLDEK